MKLPLKDIKPNVEIIDYHFYFFLVFLGVVLIVAFFFAFRLFKEYKRKRELIHQLKNLDLNNSKFIAYHFKEYAKEFIEKEKELFETIENELQKYKYKKNPPPLDEELKEKIKTFIRKVS